MQKNLGNRHVGFKTKPTCYVIVSSDSNLIQIRGAQVDTIAAVGDIYPNRGEPQTEDLKAWQRHGKETLAWLENNQEMCQSLSVTPAGGLFKSYWRTLVGDESPDRSTFPCDKGYW